MIFAAETDRGLVRDINEDSYRIIEGSDGLPNLFVIADGMGGHSCGELASKTAVEYISGSALKGRLRSFLPLERCKPELVKLLEETNEAVYRKSLEIPSAVGMGTTLTMALIDEKAIAVAHVGDSRLYMLRAGKMEQLTTDHSYIEELVRQGSLTREEAEKQPRKNIITRAIGCFPELKVDVTILKTEKDDIFLICTDGLTNMLGDSEIYNIIKDAEPNAACKSLIEAALGKGGEDNITVILIKC